MRTHRSLPILLTLGIAAAASAAAQGEAPPAHGLWVWKTATVLATQSDIDRLHRLCRSAGVTEVYLSFPSRRDAPLEGRLAALVAALHGSGWRVEALLSSTDADEPGTPRAHLTAAVQAIVEFNTAHPHARFDGVHLDIEPQQRAENKGDGNLRFLPGLIEAYRAVGALAAPAGLGVNADIARKVLGGTLQERRALFGSVSRVTLMLYEVSRSDDDDAAKIEKLRATSRAMLAKAYADQSGAHLAPLMIGLRTPDYGTHLPDALAALDDANRADANYAGWARHSYNDTLQ